MPEQLDMGWEVKVPAYAVQGSKFEDGLDNRQDNSQLEHGMSGHELWSLGVAVVAMSGRSLERYKQGSMTQVGKWSMKRWRIAEVEINCCS